MSNKIVPNIYRAVIDDVIQAIKPEFDEYGVAEDVLAELQHKWESKVMASRVAEFDNTPQQPAVPPAHAQAVAAATATHHAYPPHPIHMHPHYATHNPYAPVAAQQGQPAVKAEPIDNRYMLNPTVPYALPPLPGPAINASRQLPPPAPSNPGGQSSMFTFKTAPPPPRNYAPPAAQPATQRIPQVDGPSESSGDEDTPSPPASGAFAPRTSHPSLPQPAAPAASSSNDSEAINSDLDDSDTEGEDDTDEAATQDTDIVFCTYDKVARVKNKWKCTLKDGMIHINGKDYLFAKCTGEFEW
ncbi:transcription factor IIA, alpha/beta subunit-domain-containing protein [Crepidotus variabilis]|uniref:Transcription factor IIA, alpha/beta subunit-domain-containing protein n=1 Tax=Crepidotus variabilis TaxID=179855 RepID=A0A9P6JP58_9AGAR|nr:transcription factor IIA, alpha/beta subunit-domain-containing protein [Crepidotus variabilis]